MNKDNSKSPTRIAPNRFSQEYPTATGKIVEFPPLVPKGKPIEPIQSVLRLLGLPQTFLTAPLTSDLSNQRLTHPAATQLVHNATARVAVWRTVPEVFSANAERVISECLLDDPLFFELEPAQFFIGPALSAMQTTASQRTQFYQHLSRWCKLLEHSPQPFSSFALHEVIVDWETLPIEPSVAWLENRATKLGIAPAITAFAILMGIPVWVVLLLLLLLLILRWLLRLLLRLFLRFFKWIWNWVFKSPPGTRPPLGVTIGLILAFLKRIFEGPPREPSPPFPPIGPVPGPAEGGGKAEFDRFKEAIRKRLEEIDRTIKDLDKQIRETMEDPSLDPEHRRMLLHTRRSMKEYYEKERKAVESG